jgi:hypothetical protein
MPAMFDKLFNEDKRPQLSQRFFVLEVTDIAFFSLDDNLL